MIRSHAFRRFFAISMALALVLPISAPVAAWHRKPPPVNVQILALNDFHGQLEAVSPTSTSGARIGALTVVPGSPPAPPPQPLECVAPTCVPAGGVEYLATHVRNLRAQNPNNTAFVSAGDLIGATPLLSALFHDEPTIEAFNLMGLNYNGVGNHEFDEGVKELLRMRYGSRPGLGYWPARRDGCHPVDLCGDGDPYGGAKFQFLAANVKYRNSGLPIFPPFAIHNFGGGARVAFVGMTLEGTPLIVSPGGIASVKFLDEAATVNRLVPLLKLLGVEAIVVLLHEGGVVGPGDGGPGTTGDPALINSCDSPRGALPPIVEAMNDEIDIVITGHTNWAVNCLIDGKIVTGAASQGRLITDIDATIDPSTRDFVPGSITVNNRIVTRDVALAPDLTSLIAEYNVVAAPLAAVQVGNTSVALNRDPLDLDPVGPAAGESLLGRLIADAQLASTAGAGAQIAFMNPGGIRSNIDPGVMTHGEAFAIQPFSNIVTTKTMTGTQIDTLLEQQFSTVPLSNPSGTVGTPRTALILQVSAGFTYTWDNAAALGSKVDPTTIKLNGTPINLAGTYRVTMNSFLATGGDAFPVFTLGTNEATGLDDLVALEQYLAPTLVTPYVPPTDQRIKRLN